MITSLLSGLLRDCVSLRACVKARGCFKRLGVLAITVSGLSYSVAFGQVTDQALLDEYLVEIERLISENKLEAARDKLAEANSANLRDESLDTIQGQLRLLESLNATANSQPAISPTAQATTAQTSGTQPLSENKRLAAADLLDSLRVAMENGQLDQVRQFSDTSPRTNSLLQAVFDGYTSMKVSVSAPQADNNTQSFLATLEFLELTTKDGSTAFPADAWKTHDLRIITADDGGQKIEW